jgi:hypothetical protein
MPSIVGLGSCRSGSVADGQTGFFFMLLKVERWNAHPETETKL